MRKTPTPSQMADKTPGQITYEAYHCACGCWRDLEPEAQQRWETAAAAAIAAWWRAHEAIICGDEEAQDA